MYDIDFFFFKKKKECRLTKNEHQKRRLKRREGLQDKDVLTR